VVLHNLGNGFGQSLHGLPGEGCLACFLHHGVVMGSVPHNRIFLFPSAVTWKATDRWRSPIALPVAYIFHFTKRFPSVLYSWRPEWAGSFRLRD
jgi:hypothetical protein